MSDGRHSGKRWALQWETADARNAVMSDPATAEAMAPVLALLGGPFTATVVQVD